MAIDGDDSYAILEKVLSTMTINVAEPSGAGNTEEVIINEDIETEPDEFIDAMAPVLIIAGTVWLVMLAVYIIVIILVIRSCKKIKKARQAYFASVAVNTPKGNSAPDENYKGDM